VVDKLFEVVAVLLVTKLSTGLGTDCKMNFKSLDPVSSKVAKSKLTLAELDESVHPI